jgi:hypothetical protein
MLFTISVAIVGYAVISTIDNPQARFAMTCFISIGLFGSVPPVLGWNANNSAGHYKRATTSGLQLAVANCGHMLASRSLLTRLAEENLTMKDFVYPDSDAPLYRRGHQIILGMLCYALVA